jgi:ubiquitin-protein ligase
MYQSPRMRRLRNDLAALERLQSESSVFRFRAFGKPAQQFLIHMKGRSLHRVRGQVFAHDDHRVEIKLGASYPRTIPEIRWVTPIYHPNISEIGMVCLGGYGTHWVPSVQLDELCNMLWDMARYHNYDIRSPYNRDAALWVASQTKFLFPLDSRQLRDLRAAQGRVESATVSEAGPKHAVPNDHPNGTSESAGAGCSENGGDGATRVRRFMNRYGGLFAKDQRPGAREAGGRGEAPDEVGSSVLAGPTRDATGPVTRQPEDEEIILLESAAPTENRESSTRENVDGIMFIE